MKIENQTFWSIPHFYLPLFIMCIIKDFKMTMLLVYLWETTETTLYYLLIKYKNSGLINNTTIDSLISIFKEHKWDSLILDPLTGFLGTLLGYLITTNNKYVIKKKLKTNKKLIIFGILTNAFYKNKKSSIISNVTHNSFLICYYYRTKEPLFLLLFYVNLSLLFCNFVFITNSHSNYISTYAVAIIWIIKFSKKTKNIKLDRC